MDGRPIALSYQDFFYYMQIHPQAFPEDFCEKMQILDEAYLKMVSAIQSATK
jgi:hypothetical protein